MLTEQLQKVIFTPIYDFVIIFCNDVKAYDLSRPYVALRCKIKPLTSSKGFMFQNNFEKNPQKSLNFLKINNYDA